MRSFAFSNVVYCERRYANIAQCDVNCINPTYGYQSSHDAQYIGPR